MQICFRAFVATLNSHLLRSLLVGTAVWAGSVGSAAAQYCVYVTNFDAGTVSFIDSTTNAVTRTIHVGGEATTADFSPDGTRAYVPSRASNTVAVIDTASRTVTGSFAAGFGPLAVGVTPDGSRIYVVNQFSADVSVVDAVSQAVIATIPLDPGSNPQDIAISANGRAYVSMIVSDLVAVIDTSTNTVINAIPMDSPNGISITPDGAAVYVANQLSATVSVIDTSTETVVATIPVGEAPVYTNMSPNGLRIYVGVIGESSVKVIDRFTNTVVASIPVGDGPEQVGVTHDGLRGYVANYYSGTVSVVDLVTNTVLSSISGFSGPNGVAVHAASCPSGGRVLTSLGDARTWIGLKNSDDQGTRFDLRTEVYKNGTLVASGLTRCMVGVTRNPNNALEALVPFDPFVPVTYNAGDVMSLKVLTRIGTNRNDTKCAGHNSAVGLRLYYDSVQRQSRFAAQLSPDPLKDFFLHTQGSNDVLDDVAPTGTTALFRDSAPVNFASGNAWKTIGAWSRTIQ